MKNKIQKMKKRKMKEKKKRKKMNMMMQIEEIIENKYIIFNFINLFLVLIVFICFYIKIKVI